MLRTQEPKNSRITNSPLKIMFCLLPAALFLFAGCGNQSAGASSDVMRRAQLLGNENIQLKREIAARDAKINELTQQLTTVQAEMESNQQRHGESILKLMEITAECQRKLKLYEKQP